MKCGAGAPGWWLKHCWQGMDAKAALKKLHHPAWPDARASAFSPWPRAPVANFARKYRWHMPVRFREAAFAYLLAGTSASLSFTLLLEGSAVIAGRGFETATNNDLFTKSWHLLLMTFVLFAIGWIFSFVTAIFPFIAGIVVANRFKIVHWLYFAAGGMITAATICLCLLYAEIPNYGFNEPAPEPFVRRYLRLLPFFLISGAIAGMACWKYLRLQSTDRIGQDASLNENV